MLSRKMVATVVATLLGVAGVANADGAFDETHFYVGGELSILNKTSYNNSNSADINQFRTSDSSSSLAIQKNELGINAFVGGRFTQYIGMELGFGFIQDPSAVVQSGGTATNKISNIYLDVLGFMPVAAYVDLVGDLGIGGLKSKANVSGVTFNNLSELNKVQVSYRIGGGIQYNFAPSWTSRAMLRYQRGNKNFLRSNTSISICILYTF